MIPSQTVRGFKSTHQKPLGVAYVEFKDEEQAAAAQELINGQKLHNRPLRAKPYVSYIPNNFIKRSRSRYGSRYSRKSKNDTVIIEPIAEENKGEGNQESKENEEAPIEGEPTTEETPAELETEDANAKIEIPLSDDTVYIGRLSPKVTDGDLREFFHEYGPTDVYIFKSRFRRNSKSVFHSNYVSALVTLKEEDAMTKALESLSKSKLKGKKVDFKPAYISKIEEVKRAAEVRAKKLEQFDQEAGGAARSAAANAGATSNIDGEEEHEDGADQQPGEPLQ